MDVAAAAHSLRTPGSAVPRPKAAVRVVASARSSIPTVGLDSHRSTTVMDQDINDAHTFFSHQQSNQIMQQINQHSMCHTYMSKQANEHLSLLAMTLSMACSFRSCSRQLDLFQLFIILHNHHSSAPSSAPSLTAVRTSLSSSTCGDATNPTYSTRVSPVSIRQPIFPDEDDADATHQAVKPKLSTKALEALSTKLELEDVDAWIVDFA